MKILFIGDIVGNKGLEAIENYLPEIKQTYHPQITIANAENVTEGRGLSQKHYKWLLNHGIDVMTMGNHTFDQRGLFEYIDSAKCLVRPYNLPSSTPGQGIRYIKINQTEIAVMNVLGKAFMNLGLDPFHALESTIEEVRKRTPFIFVDFHAESTSEKQAFAWWLDGRVSAVIGTHTHVQTNDAQILPQGTAYLTDCGMTGAYQSIIGFKVNNIVDRFVTQLPNRMEVQEEGPYLLSAVYIELNDKTAKADKIKLIRQCTV